MTLIGVAATGCGPSSSSPAPSPAPASLSPQQILQQAGPGTVLIRAKVQDSEVSGSGFVFDASKGFILTNAHVVEGISVLKVRVGDQPEVSARVVGESPCDDVAVVQLTNPAPGLKALQLGRSKDVHAADSVTALGFPETAAKLDTEKVNPTAGIVQQTDIAAEPDPSLPKYPHLVQHSAAISPGNSGGPLLNDRGEVVGINTLYTGTSGRQSQNYSITIDSIRPLIKTLSDGKSIGDVGWNIVPLSQFSYEQFAKDAGFAPGSDEVNAGAALDAAIAQAKVDGLVVLGTVPGTAAEAAKLRSFGDIIQTIKGTTVTSVGDVCDILESATPGSMLAVHGLHLLDNAQDYDTNLVVPTR